MDRHVIANMGAELGATTTVFPADDEVRRFLASEDREDDFTELLADDGVTYDVTEDIDLSEIVPLIAKPSSPGNVVPVSEVAGEPVGQVVIGSSANPGLRDFAIAARIVEGRQTDNGVSFDINPSSREILADLTHMGATTELIQSGARIHQAGCMGCIGMGQAPAPGTNSLRTFPRNFPGRSGAGADDQVWLCSPETAAASALTGKITDPRALADELDLKWGDLGLPEHAMVNTRMLEEPAPAEKAGEVELVKGPNISGLPEFDRFPDEFEIPILLKVGDDISTDDISPAGAAALPFRSNIPKLAQFAFVRIDEDYPANAEAIKESGHAIVGGDNYGQGSSREHAAICPRYLGLRVVIAKSFARIHWQNLANFGILALEFADGGDYDALEQGATLSFSGVRDALQNGAEVTGTVDGTEYTFHHQLSERQVSMVLAGGLIRQIAESEA
jgi:aconitate hydratase